MRAKSVFKAQFGFSLDIDAIDPNYTLGNLEAHKREIRERLKSQHLFDLNKRLPAPGTSAPLWWWRLKEARAWATFPSDEADDSD